MARQRVSVEFKISYRCNRDCIFCDFGDRREQPILSNSQVLDNLKYFSASYDIYEAVVSGGEPTLRYNLLTLLRRIFKIINCTIYLHTNAIFFAKMQRAKSYSMHIQRALIGYHAHTEHLYQQICRRAGQEVVCTSIKNLLLSGVKVRTNTVITCLNIKHIKSIVSSALELGVRDILITYPFAIGRTHEHFSDLVPFDLKQVALAIEGGLGVARSGGANARFQGLPLCMLPNELEAVDLWTDRIFVDSLHQFENACWLFRDIIHPEYDRRCINCAKRGVCHGASPDVLLRGWRSHIRPFE